MTTKPTDNKIIFIHLTQIINDNIVNNGLNFLLNLCVFIVVLYTLVACFMDPTPDNCKYFMLPDLLISILTLLLWITSFKNLTYLNTISRLVNHLKETKEDNILKDE
jgi:hypothetical protein